jgi:hypothetical protein
MWLSEGNAIEGRLWIWLLCTWSLESKMWAVDKLPWELVHIVSGGYKSVDPFQTNRILNLTNGNNKKNNLVGQQSHFIVINIKWGFYGFPQNPQQIYNTKNSNAPGIQIRLGIIERTTNHKPQHTWFLRSLQVFKFTCECQIEWMRPLLKANNKYYTSSKFRCKQKTCMSSMISRSLIPSL